MTCPSNNPSQASTSDQRGFDFPRQLDGDNNGTAVVDIGAYEAAAPTAAGVTVGGRILFEKNGNRKGRGIGNVRVTITFPDGETRSTISNPLGYYRFADIPAGETYILTAVSKRYAFAENNLVKNIVDDTYDIDFFTDSFESMPK